MDKLVEYFSLAKINNKKLYLIIEDLISLYGFIVVKDNIINDIRTIVIKKNLFEITIKSSILINDNFEKKEFIEALFYGKKFIIINDY